MRIPENNEILTAIGIIILVVWATNAWPGFLFVLTVGTVLIILGF